MSQQIMRDEKEEYAEMPANQERIRDAYVKERKQLEIIEIELNRSKIIVIDEQGRKKRIPILSEH